MRQLPAPVPVILIEAADWAAKDWAADALPHLAYGLVTYATLHASACQ